MMGIKCLLFLTLAIYCTAENKRLKEVFSWKTVEYAFDKPADREAAIKSGAFKPDNNLPLGLDVWRDKLFITVPRWKDGVPSSLNYISIEGVKPGKISKTSPALIPYPSLAANTPSKDSQDTFISSVFRVRVDACDRLWVMDTGVADVLGSYTVYTPPQIVVYNLLTDKLVKKYVFKPEDSQEGSFFANIIVDVSKEKCDEAFAYVPDLGSYAIVVYDLKNDKAHRIKHNYFHFSPLEGNYNVGGVNFQWTDGVFGIALTRPLPDGSKTAYFHALSSYSQFQVNTLTLQNAEASKNYTAYSIVGNKGPNSQTSASFIHEATGVMFYTQVNKDAIYCWNTGKPFQAANLQEVASDDKTMIFPNDLKVDYNNNLWVLTDKLPVFVKDHLDPKEVNYRIFFSTVADAIKDTTCAP